MPKKRKWQSSITFQNRQLALGHFDTKEEAHEAYLAAARKLQGEFANDGLVKELLEKPADPSMVVPLGFGA